MRLLFDTNVFLTIIGERVDSLKRLMREALISSESAVHVSVASLWEIAIKVRLGKLALGSLIENLRLVTIDRVLVAHPLAWRA